ncbi:hypothetical protein EK904_000017 [Melospiza melodia maxima]|nr:hypothetical protein EK904_000017 [Melospiza melodia maxima]
MKAGDCVNVIFPRVLSSNNEVSVRFSPQEGDPQQNVSQAPSLTCLANARTPQSTQVFLSLDLLCAHCRNLSCQPSLQLARLGPDVSPHLSFMSCLTLQIPSVWGCGLGSRIPKSHQHQGDTPGTAANSSCSKQLQSKISIISELKTQKAAIILFLLPENVMAKCWVPFSWVFTTPQKNRKNFANVTAPAPTCTSEIQGGVWDLGLSGVRQYRGLWRMENLLAWVSWDHKGDRENNLSKQTLTTGKKQKLGTYRNKRRKTGESQELGTYRNKL